MGKPQKHKQDQISFNFFFSHFRPVSNLKDNHFWQFLQDWATFYIYRDDQTTARIHKKIWHLGNVPLLNRTCLWSFNSIGLPLRPWEFPEKATATQRQADRQTDCPKHFSRRFESCTFQSRSYLDVDFLHDDNPSMGHGSKKCWKQSFPIQDTSLKWDKTKLIALVFQWFSHVFISCFIAHIQYT